MKKMMMYMGVVSALGSTQGAWAQQALLQDAPGRAGPLRAAPAPLNQEQLADMEDAAAAAVPAAPAIADETRVVEAVTDFAARNQVQVRFLITDADGDTRTEVVTLIRHEEVLRFEHDETAHTSTPVIQVYGEDEDGQRYNVGETQNGTAIEHENLGEVEDNQIGEPVEANGMRRTKMQRAFEYRRPDGNGRHVTYRVTEEPRYVEVSMPQPATATAAPASIKHTDEWQQWMKFAKALRNSHTDCSVM